MGSGLALAGAGSSSSDDLYSASSSGPPIPSDDLYAVSSPDGVRVVAVGAHGAIRVSGDGGASWRAAPAPVDSTLTSVSLADARHGWAVGMHGVLLATRDGGASWVRQPLPAESEAVHLLGVYALDARQALAVGTWGARLRTDDAGQSWQDTPIEIGADHPRFAWLDPAERARVRRGGSVREDVALQSVGCRRGGEHCALAGEFGTLQVSRDAGRSWRAAEIDSGVAALTSPLAEGATEAPAAPELAGPVAALDRQPTARLEVEAFASPDEMRRLVRQGEPGPLFELLEARLEAARAAAEAAGAPADRVRAAGRPPFDLAEFGGADPALLERYLASRRASRPALRWTLRLRPLLYDVAWVDGARAVAVGLGGVVLRSDDGGQRWRPEARRGDTALYAASPSGQGVWIAGDAGALLAPDATAPPAEPRGRFLRGLAFALEAPDTGFAVGEGGLILGTRDAGRSWTPLHP